MSVHPIRKILAANRGEIAIRILRAASELNLITTTIYTYEDRYSQHRLKADESFQIGDDGEALKPYLDIEAIIQICKENNIDAIHPGYGFLSENVNLVKRCKEEGIVFVGPDPASMEALGNKENAKQKALELKIPTIQANNIPLTSIGIAIKEAERIGYPVMLKATSGGGGRGMRVIRSKKDLDTEFVEARQEAKKSFADDRVFLEKFIENPKHIEVQIIGDKYGNLVHLFERDCSVQRRFQKVVEFAPATTLSQNTRDKLYTYALDICRSVNYSNAGTVEFLVDNKENIYFIEVNPRIQVEHTITEQITNIDIVRTQILVSMGLPLDHPSINLPNQESIHLNGVALQCRVTTEDPSQDFKPDYGNLIAYRSASGFGIRLDAGSAFPGARISPFFDSLLVKVTATGRTLEDATQRMHRALREFRVRGVKTNIGFLLNLLKTEEFVSGKATVNFIKDHPELLIRPKWKDRSTKMLSYLAETIINGNKDVKFTRDDVSFPHAIIPNSSHNKTEGLKQLLSKLGREDFIKQIKSDPKIHYTDTTFRDAHQSLLATRMRTIDMLNIAESYSSNHGSDLFSMEVWGGATFDVSMRFLKESPWERLESFRTAMPNILLQMLLRGSNAVGYKAYPDNLIQEFVIQSSKSGVDIFRIFDSLNWLEAMKPSIQTVINETDSLAEVCMCYTGDIMNPEKSKYNLDYYLDLAKSIEDTGAHLLCIKDMAGLLKPLAAEKLISNLKSSVDLPIHLHTHDTSSIQSATYLKAIDSGVDIIDVSISSMSGLTAQPSFNSIVAMVDGHERDRSIDLGSLNKYANYWENVRKFYYPFETELRSGTAEVYDHEIPGGQYSNLRPQARALGLEDEFDQIKQNYALVNTLFGGLIKVTPSSKVVGDMALFMTSNNLTVDDILTKSDSLAFPDSVIALMRGELGQPVGGFPSIVQKAILKNEKPFTDRPNAHLKPIDWEEKKDELSKFISNPSHKDILSYCLYDSVFLNYTSDIEKFGDLSRLPTLAFLYGLKPNEEITVSLQKGKSILVKFLNVMEADDTGYRLVFFSLNGQVRSIRIKDQSLIPNIEAHKKAEKDNEIGSPLQGNLSQILVETGDVVPVNGPLFTIEAMKMESTVTAHENMKIGKIHLKEKTLVETNDLVIEYEKLV